MNGSEVVTRQPQKTAYNQAPELNDQEKMDLVAGDGTPFANAIYKLMESRVLLAQTEAIKSDPADERNQRSKMTIAHAMDKFYTDVREMIRFEKTSHITDIKQRAAALELEEAGKLEEIILAQATGSNI